MSILTTTILLVILLLVLLMLGLPVAFAMGGSAVIFGLITIGIPSFQLMASAVLDSIRTIILIAIPLFIFMGNILQISGIADDLYQAAHKWIGGLRGGLGVGTVLICTVFAACTGVSGAATVTMGLIALPSMLNRGYSKGISVGSVMAGGALGQLIPPSLMFILYGFMARESVGRLFAGGILPGLILSSLFTTYILIRCGLRPNLGPSLPREERASWKEKFVSLRSVVLPILLVIAVLGSIFSGFATPTEAAAVGSFGAILCAAIYRRLTWSNLKQAFHQTLSLSVMVMWIVIGAIAFTSVFAKSGGTTLIQDLLLGLELHPLLIVVVMQLTLMVLGCFMDPGGIILLCTPIFIPVITELGFSSVWFGVLFVLNMEMAFLTPPYGINLFYIRGVAPPGVSMMDIYLAALPFVAVQATGLILILLFPQIALWIPNLLFGA